MVLKHWFTRSVIAFLTLTSVALAGAFNRQPAGLIKGARLSYVSGTTIKVGVGYGDISGKYWEIDSSDTYCTDGYALTGVPASTIGSIQYVYIDGANSLFPKVTLKNSATAPAWSDTDVGWYNGVDRCIGALYILPDGTIKSFVCSQDDSYLVFTPNLISTVATTTYPVWNEYDLTPVVPINAYAVRLLANMGWNGVGAAWTNCTVGLRTEQAGAGSQTIDYNFEYGVGGASITDWLEFPRGSSKMCAYLCACSNNPSANSGRIQVQGYRIER